MNVYNALTSTNFSVVECSSPVHHYKSTISGEDCPTVKFHPVTTPYHTKESTSQHIISTKFTTFATIGQSGRKAFQFDTLETFYLLVSTVCTQFCAYKSSEIFFSVHLNPNCIYCVSGINRENESEEILKVESLVLQLHNAQQLYFYFFLWGE